MTSCCSLHLRYRIWDSAAGVKIPTHAIVYGLREDSQKKKVCKNVGRGGRYINNLKKQLKVQNIGIFEEILFLLTKKGNKNTLKMLFQPLHNEVKSVLGIKESYSMEKKA